MGCDTTLPVRPATRPFQSTHPVWDATPDVVIKTDPNKFQSTHPVWDATSAFRPFSFSMSISIHASRMGCDFPQGDCACGPPISIHASRMGCDYGHELADGELAISIHASRMGCDLFYPDMRLYQCISIHASRMGCDKTQQILGIRFSDFNPRIPYGMRPT